MTRSPKLNPADLTGRPKLSPADLLAGFLGQHSTGDDDRSELERLFGGLSTQARLVWRAVRCLGCTVDAAARHARVSVHAAEQHLVRCDRVLAAIGETAQGVTERYRASLSPESLAMLRHLVEVPRRR